MLREKLDPFCVSLETVVAASTLLGHDLESRRGVRERQDPALAARFQTYSAVPLRNASQRTLFTCAPLDVLVADNGGRKEFHLIELNGTGIGGVTNVPASAVSPILDDLREIAARIVPSDAVVLLGISGKESPDKPRLNKLMHEKMLFAEALKDGLQLRHGYAKAVATPQIEKDPATLEPNHPMVVMGYMKELMVGIELDAEGALTYRGRRIAGILNDRFCLNVLDHFGKAANLAELTPINATFLPGADKAVAYALLNQFLESRPTPAFPERIRFKLAHNRSELIRDVVDWLRAGRKVVIKPHATGVGHGIELFLDPNVGVSAVVAQIDGSIRLTASYYGATGGAFPYTVCEFVDTCIIDRVGHPLQNHKYELRVVVYRDEDVLRAVPSIVKIASRAYDPKAPDRLSLINNVTAATENGDKRGIDFMMPLCNAETIALLGLTADDLSELSLSCTHFVRHVLDSLEDSPERFGIEGRASKE
jgi:hypothetical protein